MRPVVAFLLGGPVGIHRPRTVRSGFCRSRANTLLHDMSSRFHAPSDAVAPAMRADYDGKPCTRGTPAGPQRQLVLQILITDLTGRQRGSPLEWTSSTLYWRETSRARRIGPGSWRLHTADWPPPRRQCALPLVILPQAVHPSQSMRPGSNASFPLSTTRSAAQRLCQCFWCVSMRLLRTHRTTMK